MLESFLCPLHGSSEPAWIVLRFWCYRRDDKSVIDSLI